MTSKHHKRVPTMIGLAAVLLTVGIARAGGPQLHVDRREVDLGRIRQGNKATASFVLENRGDQDLHIQNVRGSCSCTVAKQLSADQKLLSPGENVTIEATFDSRGRSGKQRKTVTVTSDDPIEPRLQLLVLAEVTTAFEVYIDDRRTDRLTVGSLRPGDRIDEKIEILPTDPGATLDVQAIELATTDLTYQTKPIRRDNRAGVRISLRVSPDAAIGDVRSHMQVTARAGDLQGNELIKITGSVTGVVVYLPLVIRNLGPVLPGTQLPPVALTSKADHPLQILGVDAGANLNAEVEERTPGKDFSVTLTIRDDAPPGPFANYVDIHTNIVQQPLIRIPLFAHVKARYEVTPPMVVLRADGGEDDRERRVAVEDSAGRTLALAAIEPGAGYLTAEQVDVPGQRRGSLKHLRIAVNGSVPPGRHDTYVRVSPADDPSHTIDIPVTILGR